MRPKSSASVLICRRSSALMVPSAIGTSYDFPVRLSVMDSVSAMAAKCSTGCVPWVPARSLQSGEPRHGDDAGGLRAEPPRTEPRECAAVLSRGLQLALRPPALGSDEERGRVEVPRLGRRRVGIEDDFRPVAPRAVVERGRLLDDRRERASRLLPRLEDDLPPSLALAAIALRAHFDALGHERDDRADAELRGLLQDELEFVEVDDGHGQVQRDARLAVDADGRYELDRRQFARDRAPRAAASVEDFDLFALVQTHDARVVELVAFERDDGAGGEHMRNEKSVSHGVVLADSGAGGDLCESYPFLRCCFCSPRAAPADSATSAAFSAARRRAHRPTCAGR